jgi:hypothetical protein
MSSTLLLFTTFTLVAAPAPAPIPWFREKYLKQIYNDHYIYTFSRWQMGDNDIDMCPEIHKSAVYFAMTGQPLWHESPLTHTRRSRRSRQRRQERDSTFDFTPYDIRWIEITVQDMIWFLIDFHMYCWQHLILLLSILMASTTTIILCILIFAQYWGRVSFRDILQYT